MKFKNKKVITYEIDTEYCGKHFMTSIDTNNEQTGVLDVYQEQIATGVGMTVNRETQKTERVVLYQRKYWDLCVSGAVGLNFGSPTFVPPKDLTNVLTDKHDTISISATTSTSLSNILKQMYKTSFVLPTDKVCSANFRQLPKTVFAYGKYDGTQYCANFVGSTTQLITDKAFTNEDNENSFLLVMGIIGLLGGAGITGVSCLS